MSLGVTRTVDDKSISEFVRLQKELLELELKPDAAEESSSRQLVVLRNLEASDISVGLYGRTVVNLTAIVRSSQPSQADNTNTSGTNRSSNNESGAGVLLLPAHRFTVGDDVEIHSSKKTSSTNGTDGVISAVTDTSISIALYQKSKNANNNAAGTKNNNKRATTTTTTTTTATKGSSSSKEDEQEDNILGLPPPLTIIPKSNVQVHKRILKALDELQKECIQHHIAGNVINALFQQQPTVCSSSQTPCNTNKIQPFNSNLDQSQLEAIAFALEPNNPIALCHGPPGTGKTTTVAELIQQAVHVHKMKLLVTAPSNVAVDNILERLVDTSGDNNKQRHNKTQTLKLVRIGHPARIKPSIVKYSLEALVQSDDGTQIVKDVRNELQSYLRILSNPKSRANDKRLAYREIKSLRKEIRTREEKVVKELLSNADVVLATTVGAASRVLDPIIRPKNTNDGNVGFDLVIIDEAAQALEASCYIPILKGKKLVMAGDHCQLPPTIMSQISKVKKGLGNTLFQRVMHLYGDHHINSNSDNNYDNNTSLGRVSRMLKVQYRMNEKIANWASNAMYGGQLQTHESVKNRTLSQLLLTNSNSKNNNETRESNLYTAKKNKNDENDNVGQKTLLLVDTAGCGMYESENTATGSKYNSGEVDLVQTHVQKLLDLGIQQEQIAIITPYNGQVEVLRNALLTTKPKLEIKSVDGFQGGEREAVILSLVRSSEDHGKSNTGGSIGFLSDNRRLNVAITRAKRHCAIICDSETVSKSNFIKGLVSYIEEYGESRSAIEFISSENHTTASSKTEKELYQMIEAGTKKENTKKQPKGKLMTKEEEEENKIKRKALLDSISKFYHENVTMKPGKEMILSAELSSFDRRIVHEFAEQIGLGHRSEGVEGINRRIILRIPSSTTATSITTVAAVASIPPQEPIQEETENDDEQNDVIITSATKISSFAALASDDDDDDDDNDNNGKEDNYDNDGTSAADILTTEDPSPPAMNTVLGHLAKERQLRLEQQWKEEQQEQEQERLRKQQQKKQAANSNQKKNAKKKKKKGGGGGSVSNNGGHRLGGVAKKVQQEDNDNDMDDMAFLDAQIEKVQTSHGRKVAGTGKGYKSVINGILINKPPPREEPKNTQASAFLQAKLKKAQNDRKMKPKNKKKR